MNQLQTNYIIAKQTLTNAQEARAQYIKDNGDNRKTRREARKMTAVASSDYDIAKMELINWGFDDLAQLDNELATELKAVYIDEPANWNKQESTFIDMWLKR